MRIVVTGDSCWDCPDLAVSILRRLVTRYGPDIVIIHGNDQGVAASFATAATDLGVKVEVRVIDRLRTGHPTVGQRNRELLMGGADLCIAVHRRVASCSRTLDCVRQTLQEGIPTFLINDEGAEPVRLKPRDRRLT